MHNNFYICIILPVCLLFYFHLYFNILYYIINSKYGNINSNSNSNDTLVVHLKINIIIKKASQTLKETLISQTKQTNKQTVFSVKKKIKQGTLTLL